MSLKVTDSGPPIIQLSNCFKNLLLNLRSNFDEEIKLIKEKFMKPDYPMLFINSVVNEFQNGKECGDEGFIIATSLFEIANTFHIR